jgi:hypothetical protein
MTIVSMAACSGCGVGVSTNGLLIPVTPGGGGSSIMIAGAGTCSTIRCGVGNAATASYSAALSGRYNGAGEPYSVVAGGKNNNVSIGSYCSAIVGGQLNLAYLSQLSFIGGGSCNCNYNYSKWSVIGGGCNNKIFGTNTTTLSSYCSVIGGGSSNKIYCSKDSFIGGGGGNLNSDSDATVIGGGILNCNIASSTLSTIGGGLGNAHNGVTFGFIGGGYKNASTSDLTFIGGGSYNITTAYNGVIGGGYFNRVCSVNSSILGGVNNIVNSGYANVHIIGSNLTGNYSDTTFTNNLRVCGTLCKSSGYFSIPHPNPTKTDTFNLLHSFVESPTEGDNIYRFVIDIVDGYGEVDLPDYYKFLNKNSQVWISPVNGFGIGYGEINEDDTKVIVKANMDIKYNVLVIGTRKDNFVKKNWKGVEREIQKPKTK